MRALGQQAQIHPTARKPLSQLARARHRPTIGQRSTLLTSPPPITACACLLRAHTLPATLPATADDNFPFSHAAVFVTYILLMQIVLTNVVVAVLLDKFVEDPEPGHAPHEQLPTQQVDAADFLGGGGEEDEADVESTEPSRSTEHTPQAATGQTTAAAEALVAKATAEAAVAVAMEVHRAAAAEEAAQKGASSDGAACASSGGGACVGMAPADRSGHEALEAMMREMRGTMAAAILGLRAGIKVDMQEQLEATNARLDALGGAVADMQQQLEQQRLVQQQDKLEREQWQSRIEAMSQKAKRQQASRIARSGESNATREGPGRSTTAQRQRRPSAAATAAAERWERGAGGAGGGEASNSAGAPNETPNAAVQHC